MYPAYATIAGSRGGGAKKMMRRSQPRYSAQAFQLPLKIAYKGKIL